MEIESGDILVCTVEKIAGTTVFVEIEGSSKKGTIILSEVAAGRIRNLRDYVVPKKTIVCKVLRVLGENVELSLRRVKEKERKEALEKNKAQKSYLKILNSILKEKTQDALKEIAKKGSLDEFLEEAKENPSELKEIVGKEASEKILEIVKKDKSKRATVKKKINFFSPSPEGLNVIKKILSDKELEINYLAAGKYSVKAEEETLKKADQKIKDFLEHAEKASKKEGVEFSVT